MTKPETSSHKVREIELEREADAARQAFAASQAQSDWSRWQEAVKRQTDFRGRAYRER